MRELFRSVKRAAPNTGDTAQHVQPYHVTGYVGKAVPHAASQETGQHISHTFRSQTLHLSQRDAVLLVGETEDTRPTREKKPKNLNPALP